MPTPDNAQLVSLSIHGTYRYARCWKITREDAEVFRFTDHDLALEIPSDGTYVPDGGLGGSAVQSSMELGDQNTTVTGVITLAAITSEELASGKFDGALVEEFRVDHRFPFAGKYRQRYYRVGKLEHNKLSGVWRAEIVGMLGQLNRHTGARNSRRCDFVLYDPTTCGVTKASFSATLTVTSVNDDGSFVATPSAHDEDDYFEDGEIEWTGGNNDGTFQSIASYDATSNTWYLHEEPFYTIEAGDTATVAAGCNHLAGVNIDGTDDETGHCKHKFDNLARFGGKPFMPTDDVLYSTPDAKSGEEDD